MVETYGSTAGTVSPELRRRLGKVYALLLSLPDPKEKTPSAQVDSGGALGAERAPARKLEAQR